MKENACLNTRRTLSRLGWTMGLIAFATVLVWLVRVITRPDGGMELLVSKAGARVEVVANASADATFADVRNWPEPAWAPWTGRGYVSAKHGNVIWMRVTLTNPDAKPLQGVLEDTSYFSDRVELWTEESDGWRQAVSGTEVAARSKPMRTRMAAFLLTVPAGGERVVYLRASDAYVAHIQPAWWDHFEQAHEAKANQLLMQCLCFGVLLALVFYNAVLWVRLKFGDTGYYVLTAGAGVVCNFTANGGFSVIGLPIVSPWHEILIAVSMGLGAMAMTKFTRVFLGTGELMPAGDRWLRGWGFVLALLTLLTPGMFWMKTPHGVHVLALAAVFTDLICMVAACVAWRRGARHARFFLMAFAFLALAGLPMAASVLREEIGGGVAMGLLIGRTLEMLLLSFAAADRFAQTQRKLVEETEQRRAIQEAYADELEVEVRERTRDLVEANADKDRMISVIGHDLRSPLTALTRTAEQLTKNAAEAGTFTHFARDAAQMGGQMLLLIEDLVLWARLRAGTTHLVTQSVSLLVEPVASLHRPLALRRGIELIVVEIPTGLVVKTDLVLAQTLLRNLVANALRYARTRVQVTACAAAVGVVITVHDDGPGLPAEMLARLKPETLAPDWTGNGLGLRLCVEISRVLKADLQVVSDKSGTRFSFALNGSGTGKVFGK